VAFTRYAVYFVPPADAPWARWASNWLGRDIVSGASVAFPDTPDLPLPVSTITATPRKYGLHATIKPPMRLANGTTIDALSDALATLCRRRAPVLTDGLVLRAKGQFLALCPTGNLTALNQLAADSVTELDRFRAPASEAELTKRRKRCLSAAQEANLLQWGYPYVLDEFRCHITLTGRLPTEAVGPVTAALNSMLSPMLPQPFQMADLAIAGEDRAGQFHLIQRYPLTG